jgi:tripartite-type tricarboxylate transporter receptor subunit TctC
MRLVSHYLKKYLHVPVPVINMPGVGGTVGLRTLSSRKPDGYTIGMIHEGQIAAYYSGLTKQDWDAFVPVAAMTESPQYLFVSTDSAWKTLADFVSYAKAHPGKIRMGATMGGISQVDPQIIANAADISFHYVGYDGTSARVRAVVGGHIDAGMGDISSTIGFVKGGQLRLLAVGTEKRQPEMPDVPTFTELGYDVTTSLVRGIVVPKGTPKDKVKILEQALKKVSEDPEFRKAAKNIGAPVHFMDGKQYSAFLAKEDPLIKVAVEKMK